MRMTKYLITAFILLTLNISLNSQEYKLSNPLFPAVNQLPVHSFGGFLGIGQNFQSGTNYVDCNNCVFSDGVGAGYTFGLVYQRKLSTNFFLGAYTTIDLMGFSSSFTRFENVTIENEEGETQGNTPLNFRHTSDADFTYLSLAPYISYNPAGFIALRTAPKISYLLSSNLIHTQEPLDRSTTIKGVEGAVTTGTNTVQDSEFRETSSLVFGMDISLLFNMTPSERTTFSLGYTQYIPFTTASDFGENLKINSWRLFVEFKYTIEEAFEKKPTYE